MFLQQAENRFQEGMRHLACGRATEALPFIGAAIELQEHRVSGGLGQALYLSYQGLCLGLGRTDAYGGLRHCRRAAEVDPINPEIWWNLGRVALMVGRRGEAHRAFHKGLRVSPGHPSLSRCLRRMGRRRAPMLSFVSRGNPINVLLGRLRQQVQSGTERPSRQRAAAASTRSGPIRIGPERAQR